MVRNLYYHYKEGNPLYGVIAPHDQKLAERINYVVDKDINRLVVRVLQSLGHNVV